MEEIKEKLMPLLESIGLTKNEVKVYLDLVQHNVSSALEISERTKIYRPNTYDALKTLTEKGFVTETIEEKKKIFRAMDLEKIDDYLIQKQQEIDQLIPYLKEISKKREDSESVSITKGVFALRSAILSLLDCGETINVYGIPKNASEILGEGFLKDFHEKRIKQQILMRHIYNQEASERISKLNKMKYTEARHLAKKYDGYVPTNICGDIVVLLVFSEPVSVIKIKSKRIAETYNKYFEILWNNARV